MKASGFFFLALAGMAAGAHAEQPADPNTLRTSLIEMLSLLTLGAVSVPAEAVQVTRSGADFRIRLPLSGYLAPAGAAAEALAHPDGSGAWDVTSMTFPSTGALGSSIDQVVSYTIGQQAIRAQLYPELVSPSTVAAELRAISLQSALDKQDTEQTIERATLGSTLSSQAAGRVDLRAQDAATNWHVVARDHDGQQTESQVHQLNGQVAITGLDRAQGGRLLAAVRVFMQSVKSAGHQPDAARDGLRPMLDATAGLLTRIEANETLDNIRFDLGHANAGTLGRLQLRAEGAAEEQRLNAAVDLAMDELALATLSADSAAFVPHHLTARSVVAGVPVGLLMALLRSALTPNSDPAGLQRQLVALLSVPGTKVAIESIAFDAGPVRVRGAARLQPGIDGEVGANIHLSASGVDTALAQLQGSPNIQGAMPLIYMAKGLGRAQGDSIVWDISLGNGPVTINGVPFGQPLARTR